MPNPKKVILREKIPLVNVQPDEDPMKCIMTGRITNSIKQTTTTTTTAVGVLTLLRGANIVREKVGKYIPGYPVKFLRSP